MYKKQKESFTQHYGKKETYLFKEPVSITHYLSSERKLFLKRVLRKAQEYKCLWCKESDHGQDAGMEIIQ